MPDTTKWLAEARKMRQAAEILLKSAAELESRAERKDICQGLGAINVLLWRPPFFSIPKTTSVEYKPDL
jgi:hypothetical protein